MSERERETRRKKEVREGDHVRGGGVGGGREGGDEMMEGRK